MTSHSSNLLCIVGCILAGALSSGCLASFSTRTTQTDTRANSSADAQPTTKPATLASGVFNWNELVVRSSEVSDTRPVFRSPTATLDELEIHLTSLKPGQRPHAPHQHPYEEMMILKEGTVEVTINDRVITMPAGSVLFIAPNDMHGWRNVGTTNATYVIVTWKTLRTGAAK